MMAEVAEGVFELPHDRLECRVEVPCLLTDAVRSAGAMLNVACGGKGICGGCAVDLLAGRFADADGKEVALRAGTARRVLACQTRLLGGRFRVRIPRGSLVEGGERIVMDFAHAPTVRVRPAVRKEHLQLTPPTLQDQLGDVERILGALGRRGYGGPIGVSLRAQRRAEAVARAGYELTATLAEQGRQWHLIDIEPGDTTGALYGVAADIGTTTLVVTLVDLLKGELVDAASSYNRQLTRCEDVASRISYASSPEAVEELRELVVENINQLIALLVRRHDLKLTDVVHMVVAGNTVMTHLFCGFSPTGLGGVPFAPITNFPGPFRAAEMDLAINPDAFVELFPSSAAYVGGDITADAYVCGLGSRDALTVLIDIGTNAEIVVGHRRRLVACAAPAGPAFEGHGLSCGMRASVGAIDTLRIADMHRPAEYTVIGQVPPAGLCGSALIDFVAQAFLAGILANSGRFSEQAKADCPHLRRVARGNGEVLAYEIVPAEQTERSGGPILITERDIAGLLQAKGVIYSGLQIALKHFGADFRDVERFYLAGGFAKHIDLDNAVAMGLLPDVERSRYTFIGNGSLGGAFLALIDSEVRAALPELAAAPTVIELNLDPQFMDAYTMAMFLPNADPSLFPSVKVAS